MRQLRKLIGVDSSTNTDLVIPEVMNKAVIKAIDQKLVLAKLPGFYLDNQLLNIGGDTVTYQFATTDTMDVAEVSPGAQIPESEEPFTSEITLKVRKIGIRPKIMNELIEDSKYDEAARQLDRATFKMARYIDRACGIGMTKESGVFPIGSGINSARLIERSPALAASGFTIPDDVVTMIGALETNEGTATDIILHPNYYVGIRAAAWFAPSVQMQQGNTPLVGQNGLVGTAYGLRWWQSKHLAYSGSRHLGSGVAIMWDAGQNPFAFLNKRPLELKRIDDPEYDVQGFAFTQRFNVMNVQPSAVVWVTGLQHKTYYREFKDKAL